MIDDITYLVENSEKNSQIVYVDSAMRNRLFFPNANEYTIDFDQPFKLVYGFDVLDAAIPVTMYNIDLYNNTMYFTVISKNTADPDIDIDPEYYFEELTISKSFIEMFEKDSETFIITGEESSLSGFIGAVTSPNENYAMFYRNLIENSPIKVRNTEPLNEYYTFMFNNTTFCFPNNTNNQPLIDIIESNDYYLRLNTNTQTYDVVYFVKNIIDKNTFTAIRTAGAHIISISNFIKSLEVGNYDAITVVNDLNDLLNTTTVDVQSTTSIPSKQAKLMFTSPNLVLLNGFKGEFIKSIGFDTSPTTVMSSNYKGWKVGTNIFVYGSVFNTSTGRYNLTSPGLISLLGERFTVLRIKELEDHLYGSYSYMSMTPGIGMFKMAATFGGVTNLRFDFTSVIRKPFHPIGKLSRLTIRFETSSGRLYDFKGVNHQLMFNIKFYVPTQKIKFSGSLLNPNYEANLMNYMSNNKSIQYKEDSDDEEEFDEDRHYEVYKKELDKYDYSSSEEEKESDDSETDVDSLLESSE
jgi:hypothetical protein